MAKKRKPSTSTFPPALFPYIQQASDDTLLLFTGMMLMTITHYVPFGNANWLGVKLILVVLYVLVGMFCLKSPPRSTKWWIGYALSTGCLCTIYWLATYKPMF